MIKKIFFKIFARKENSLPKHSKIANFIKRRATVKENLEYKKVIKENNEIVNSLTFASTLVNLSSTKLNTSIFSSEENLKMFYEEFFKNQSNTTLYVPEKGQIFLTNDSFVKLSQNYSDIIKKYSDSKYLTYNTSLEHFNQVIQNTDFVLIPKGFYGALYNFAFVSQPVLSTTHLLDCIKYSKTFQVSGLRILQTHPLFLLALPTVTALSFYGFGKVAGDNTVGKVLNLGGYIMMTPMRYFELLFNVYVTPVFVKVTGFPLILNFTKTMEVGQGIQYDDVKKYLTDNKSIIYKVWKAISKEGS